MALYEVNAVAGQLMGIWIEAKLAMKQSVPFGSGWLHLIVGPFVSVGAALLMRKPLSSWWPWLVVFVIASVNEFIDVAAKGWLHIASQYVDSASDFLMTIAGPTLLLIFARYFPSSHETVSRQRPRPG